MKISFAHKKIDKQYETTRNEVSKMKKFISANEEIVHKLGRRNPKAGVDDPEDGRRCTISAF